jgi:hypothetical protein
MPVLTRHGLSFTTRTTRVDGDWCLVGVLRHTSGDSDEGRLPIHGGTPQELGSSITYARRYLLGCMTGIVTDDDDDAQVANSSPRVTDVERERREQEQREAAQRAAAEQRARDIATATADSDTVQLLRTDAVFAADSLSDPLARKEALLGVWSRAREAGALGCVVDVPEPWQYASNGATCTLHQLISGAQNPNLPQSGEGNDETPEADPWATNGGGQ